MTLSEAKAIADSPAGHDAVKLNLALNRLYLTQFSQRTDGALQRFERRIQSLRDHLGSSVAVGA